MKRVLVVVDMQNDFIDGSLGTKEAVLTVEPVIRLIREGEWDAVYATLDTHPENYLETFEGKNLPVVHCVKGTEGWQIRPEVKAALEEKHAVYVEKPGFGSEVLREMMLMEHPDEITMCGLCTDICVLCNAMILRGTFIDIPIKVKADAMAGVTPEKHDAALKVMASCQMEII